MHNEHDFQLTVDFYYGFSICDNVDDLFFSGFVGSDFRLSILLVWELVCVLARALGGL